MSDPFLAALAGLGSAATLELLRHVLARISCSTQRSLDDATAFRQDLLERIGSLEDDHAALSKERADWQGRYYAEREARARAEWQIEVKEGRVSTPIPLIPSSSPTLSSSHPSISDEHAKDHP